MMLIQVKSGIDTGENIGLWTASKLCEDTMTVPDIEQLIQRAFRDACHSDDPIQDAEDYLKPFGIFRVFLTETVYLEHF